ncbi:MAG: BamA/TamA family outer membrane protein [Acidobacteria bacterium]|nr:BamA/TamA family outer membrane protein [Acidobacteriota bacterium]
MAFFFAAILPLAAQETFDGRTISTVTIRIDGGDDPSLRDDLQSVLSGLAGTQCSASAIRDSVEALYRRRPIDHVRALASLDPGGGVEVIFVVKPKARAGRVTVSVEPHFGDQVTEQEILFKLNLLRPGTAVTEQLLQSNATQILEYLRDRGYYRSDVAYSRNPSRQLSDEDIEFRVKPGTQSRVEAFAVDIEGYDKPFPVRLLKLTKGEAFSRQKLSADVERLRDHLKKEGFLAPRLNDPRIVYDPDTDLISVTLSGRVGPSVNIEIETDKVREASGSEERLLPVSREGTLDYAAIIEGERRLENYYQERGYFFVDVVPVCSVDPPLADADGVAVPNESEFLCSFLGSEDLLGRKVTVRYRTDLGRRLTLDRIQMRGTDVITIDDVRGVLGSQEANFLGFLPLFGYGRGFTSTVLLEDDAATLSSLMFELGYREAQVRVLQGVSPNGDSLIITFQIEDGPATVVNSFEIVGNTVFSDDELKSELPEIVGKNLSRARNRNSVQKITEYYASRGYFDVRVTSSLQEDVDDTATDDKEVKVIFRVENEGKQVRIGRVFVTGNERTRPKAIIDSLTFKQGELLRSSDIYSSEQNLYSTDAFERVEVTPRPAGEIDAASRVSDVVVDVEEQKPRVLAYGGGFSTDVGLSGFFDLRHSNLFGRLWQGGARLRVSQRQQLAQFDFTNPRFLLDGKKRFAPLTFTALYQRDTTVTRFFRSAFDKGTFGIVQRLDEEGNPIDEFGNRTGSPTINRLAFFAETNRTISLKSRSILFLRYRFEDVRLFNINSLLVKDLLIPDRKTRISGFGATYVRDTRRNCVIKYTILEIIAKGDPTEPCRYNASDPTNGFYITADYNVSLPQLGANIGFNKFQAGVNYFYTIRAAKNTTLAARGLLGVANVFSNGNRFTDPQFTALNGLLPISERFFAGGANTLRGFDFEEAGPRVVIIPQGIFRNSNGEPVTLDPFTIPFGGNALAVVNLEARIPISTTIRAVPFYDGGNVFRRPSDIFRRPEVPPGDIVRTNQRAVWTHSVGLGLRLKTPVGGEFGVDYGYLLNPPRFLIPQAMPPPANFILKKSQIHFRFSQAF